MGKLPAFQFYPGDWRKDVGVQSLNYHDRGVWFEMLCLMHESPVRGKLMIGGKAASDDILATVLHMDLETLRGTVTTLLERGICDRDLRTGALMSRRMVRDEQALSKNRGKLAKWRKDKKTKDNGNQNETNHVTQMKPLSSSSSSSSISSSTSVCGEENAPPPSRPAVLPVSAGASGEFMAAHWLGEELGIAFMRSELPVVAKVIGFEARIRGDTQAGAEFIRDEGLRAQRDGGRVDFFWIKDRKWNNQERDVYAAYLAKGE